jgi:NTE family protein
MTEIARRIGNVRTALSALDPSLSGAGLLAGKRLIAIFSPFISQQYFHELVLPMAAVTTDIGTGERVAITSGEVMPAMRASCAIPLVFTPGSIDGRVLVDGGLTDPVPVDVARELGADLVVGVNVVPQLQRSGPSALSRVFRQVNRFNPLARLGGTSDLPDLVDVMMSTMQTVYHELGNVGAVSADVAINVDTSGYSWIDFHHAMDLIERGRAAGEAAAPKMRALLDARLRGA